MTHYMNLNAGPFRMMRRGEKTVELRLYDEKRQAVRVGDEIVFTCRELGEKLTAKVLALHVFPGFRELYEALDLTKCGYTAENAGEADWRDMDGYYTPREQAEHSVVGIELEVIKRLFHRFASHEQRRAFGGSDFVEIQRCRMPADVPDEEKVAVHAVEHWDYSSLFVYGDDWNSFLHEYGDMLGNGLYANLSLGPVDGCGINYYNGEKTSAIMDRLAERRPREWETLLGFLDAGGSERGFYILGL